MAPATYVYEGKIPQRFLDVAEECGGLQSGENVEFFYSDGFADVKEGFCYVSDQKVAVFYPDDEPPLIVIPYREIKSVELERNESDLVDSIITVHLESDEVWIFVSSEMDRDVDFLRRSGAGLISEASDFCLSVIVFRSGCQTLVCRCLLTGLTILFA